MAVQKKYICGFCARAFTRLEHKQRHERSHTNEKPFHCLYCTSAFVRRDLLQRHCRTVHNIKLVSQSKRRSSVDVKPVEEEEKDYRFEKIDDDDTPNEEEPLESESRSPSAARDHDDPLQLIHLLLITKNLNLLLDPHDLQLCSVNDTFLIGYTILLNQPYSIFETINKDLIQFLNSNLNGNQHKLLDFKICLIYAILSIGCQDELQEQTSALAQFLNKLWNILIQKLIPNYNSLTFQLEILKNLFILSFINLRSNNNHLILEYLDDTSFIILENLANNLSNDFLNEQNAELFWNIYILISDFKINDKPPKSFPYFLKQAPIDTSLSLQLIMNNYSKSINFTNDNFLNNIVVATLSNELNLLIYKNTLQAYDSKNLLHNSIILINKSINKDEPASNHFDLFKIFKKKLLINSPVRFKELLNSYIFKISHRYQWNLLAITLKETNLSFNFGSFINMNLNAPFQLFANNLLMFFTNSLPMSPTPHDYKKELDSLLIFFLLINNNLGIVSFPIIFQWKFLRFERTLKYFDFRCFNAIDISHLNNLLVEWYITTLRILVNLVLLNQLHAHASNVFAEDDFASIKNNYILQCLLYLLNDEDPNFDIHLKEWILKTYARVEEIYTGWLLFLSNESYLYAFKTNLSFFMKLTFELVLNDAHYVSLHDLYASSDSILAKDVGMSKRSKSISAIEHNLSALSTVKSPYSNNYVLINKNDSKVMPLPQLLVNTYGNGPGLNHPPTGTPITLQIFGGQRSLSQGVLLPPLTPTVTPMTSSSSAKDPLKFPYK